MKADEGLCMESVRRESKILVFFSYKFVEQ